MKKQSGVIHILLPVIVLVVLGAIIFFVSSVGKVQRLEQENQYLYKEVETLKAEVALIKFKVGL